MSHLKKWLISDTYQCFLGKTCCMLNSLWGHPLSKYAGREREKSCHGCAEEGFKPGECVRISTVYFPVFEDFLDKKEQ